MRKLTRREFAQLSALGAGALMLPLDVRKLLARQVPGGTLNLAAVSGDKFTSPLIKPPAMPRSDKISRRMAKNIDYYEIAVRQFDQQILPAGYPSTTVWSYGAVDYPGTVAEGGTFNYPAFTIEAKVDKPVRVKWINDLVDADGDYLEHLLPVDQTLHWANPPGPRDRRGSDPTRYTGPVPIVTHVHGAHTTEDSDGYPEAWYLPNANNIDVTYETGTFFDHFNSKYNKNWGPGWATFNYPNDQPATTLWYHDHTLGMTRLNVYAGPAGFWLIRGGDYDTELGYVRPGSFPANPLGEYTEIPIVIQDRSFNSDGSLFYPDNRAFFEGLDVNELDIPFAPNSDVAPIWNPEFFGNVMVVNGSAWPYLDVDRRKYRFRFLNGCNSRFLILKASNGMKFHQIGGDQGFLPNTVELDELLMAPAERADVIMDFSNADPGAEIVLLNLGPDDPFGGGIRGEDYFPSDPDTTGKVMQFRVRSGGGGGGRRRRRGGDDVTDTAILPTTLPAAAVTAGPAGQTRNLTLNEEESLSVIFEGEIFGPTAALLGVGTSGGTGKLWMENITEDPAINTTEEWVIHNFTADAHPIHVHQVKFEVLGRIAENGDSRGPEPWETGPKDTVISYPGEKTRIRMHFDLPGYYVWHCHIVEHEDNEMMRPYFVTTPQVATPDGPQP
jgi:spore coat protein A